MSTLAFLNDHVETEAELDGTNFTGGLVSWEYLDIEYKPSKGAIVLFPANYMAAHSVSRVSGGSRYSHVGWYCHGTPNGKFNESVIDPLEHPEMADITTNIYMSEGYKLPDVR